MSFIKKTLRGVSNTLPLGLLRRSVSIPVLLPYHHLISDGDVPHVSELYAYKTIRQFRADVDWLLRHYVPVSFADVYEHLFEKKVLPTNAFLLSFDDGFREVKEFIAPILKEKGVPAVFFY